MANLGGLGGFFQGLASSLQMGQELKLRREALEIQKQQAEASIQDLAKRRDQADKQIQQADMAFQLDAIGMAGRELDINLGSWQKQLDLLDEQIKEANVRGDVERVQSLLDQQRVIDETMRQSAQGYQQRAQAVMNLSGMAQAASAVPESLGGTKLELPTGSPPQLGKGAPSMVSGLLRKQAPSATPQEAAAPVPAGDQNVAMVAAPDEDRDPTAQRIEQALASGAFPGTQVIGDANLGWTVLVPDAPVPGKVTTRTTGRAMTQEEAEERGSEEGEPVIQATREQEFAPPEDLEKQVKEAISAFGGSIVDNVTVRRRSEYEQALRGSVVGVGKEIEDLFNVTLSSALGVKLETPPARIENGQLVLETENVGTFPDRAWKPQEMEQVAQAASVAIKRGGQPAVEFFARSLAPQLEQYVIEQGVPSGALVPGGERFTDYRYNLLHPDSASFRDMEGLVQYLRREASPVGMPPAAVEVRFPRQDEIVEDFVQAATVGEKGPSPSLGAGMGAKSLDYADRWIQERSRLLDRIHEYAEGGLLNDYGKLRIKAWLAANPSFTRDTPWRLAGKGPVNDFLAMKVQNLFMGPERPR